MALSSVFSPTAAPVHSALELQRIVCACYVKTHWDPDASTHG